MKIRPATLEDVDLVAWTVLEALDLPTDELELARRSCADPEGMYSWTNALVAEVDGKPAGCLISYDGARYMGLREHSWPTLWTDYDEDYLRQMAPETGPGEHYLDSMALRPEFRGRGIGKALMRAAMEAATAAGATQCALLVDVDKAGLARYYESVGFRPEGEILFFGHRYTRMTFKPF